MKIFQNYNLKIFCVSLLILYASCGTRRVETSKTKYFEKNVNEWSRTAPGDRVYIPAPKHEPPRPNSGDSSKLHLPAPPGQAKDTTLRETGENGAVLTVRLRGEKFIDADCDCPYVQESGSEARELNVKTKNKESERKSLPWGWLTATGVTFFFLGFIARKGIRR